MPGSPVSVRPAMPADYDAVVTVWKEGWDSIGISNTADEAVTWDMLRARLPVEVAATWSLYVAEVAGEIVGMLALEVADNHLCQLFVAPHAQSAGIGKALLAFCRDTMPGEIWLTTAAENQRARDWYEHEGFVLEQIVPKPEFRRDLAVYRWRA